jgi:hypothetical protein
VPASIPGSLVLFDLLSGPKGSPLDRDNAGNASTGALSTGIGYGSTNIAPCASTNPATAGQAIKDAGFTDECVPGVTNSVGGSTSSAMIHIGGGRSDVLGRAVPYTTGYGIGAAGNGAPRDAGAGPSTFTGFAVKAVTAAGAVANGEVVETGYENRTGAELETDESTFGVSTTPTAMPA